MSMGKYLLAVGIGALLVAGGLLGYQELKDNNLGAVVSSDIVHSVTDVVGTHLSSTSTTGVALTSATTSYISKIGNNKNTAIYQVQMVSTQVGTNYVSMQVLGSNDYLCDTTVTSTVNEVQMSQINWYGVGDHLRGKAQTVALGNASSTNNVVWTSGVAGQGQTLILENLSYQCLKLNIAGSSSTVYVGLSTK